MLVLSGKSQQSIVLGGCDGFDRILKITALDISGEKVRLGFEMDADVAIHGLEVWELMFPAAHGMRLAGPPEGHDDNGEERAARPLAG